MKQVWLIIVFPRFSFPSCDHILAHGLPKIISQRKEDTSCHVVASHLIYERTDVLFVLPEDEKALLPVVSAHRQCEHVEAGLRTLQ